MTPHGGRSGQGTDPLVTPRLVLRRWRGADLAPFAAMNADPMVMEFLPSTMTREESDAWVHDRLEAHFAQHGYGPWAVERRDDGAFIGYVGLMWQVFEAPFTPALEVGWRLAREQWGQGFATEAAAESLRFAFEVIDVGEVVSMTVPRNTRSTAVMERIGMTRTSTDDFDHPRLPEGHRLRRHVLYRLSSTRWSALSQQADT